MTQTIQDIATALVAPNKGILAADESESTMQKRFAPIGVEQNVENDRRYRNLLFTAPGIEECLSGVILHDETIRQCADDGTPFPTLLAKRGIVPGIKVDQGLMLMPGSKVEEVSHGFEGFHDRLHEYYDLGARFTKWRSVIHIGEGLPTQDAIDANAEVLAKYAALVQQHDMVPMVEPEVLFDGTHTLERSSEVLGDTLGALFGALAMQGVDMRGLILKTSMALPGKDSGIALVPADIARETLAVLHDAVPTSVAGIVFLSGGQTSTQATENLNAIAQLGTQSWSLTFSYSRAIEEPVLFVWKGDDVNIPSAQEMLLLQLTNNVSARNGTYVSA
ncbi:MAG: fructose-bisphosphate aldolase class I [Candidatus Pacebacteria bacterium]|nr:fructose-bisphosphate aldolase class I [Candidatus Paceibacterota bacterium]